MPKDNYEGLLLIGDPHLEGRVPGFRKDDYPQAILAKLRWCLAYAAEHRLLPALLGDLFDKPRDNPNWLLVELLDTLDASQLGTTVLSIYGNHDVHYNPQLTGDDSLMLLIKAGKLRLVCESPWQGVINDRPVIVGGSSYRQELPKQIEPASLLTDASTGTPLVVWLTHHDILIPGYDEGRIRPREIPGVDLLVNGHIHRHLDDIVQGQTRWVTPGNISRRSRSDATREHTPRALRIDITPGGYDLRYIEVPHRPFEEVFHEAIVAAADQPTASAFVAGLAELQARRTAAGAGLMEFLEQNLNQFEPAVASEILLLAQEQTTGEQADE